jgi:hypothetical protein
MSDEFREDVKETIRRHDPDAATLRALSDDLDALADRYETQEEIL